MNGQQWLRMNATNAQQLVPGYNTSPATRLLPGLQTPELMTIIAGDKNYIDSKNLIGQQIKGWSGVQWRGQMMW